ncbi:hypothetical protein JHK87_052546 [Glycine soja]|nr:hypothetical protein JHK87_052546 [Glycine soja]
MVQRLTYRKRHNYATKSNQHRVIKTLFLVLIGSVEYVMFGFVGIMQVGSSFIRLPRRGPTDPSALSLAKVQGEATRKCKKQLRGAGGNCL